jgi:hypothetical protein
MTGTLTALVAGAIIVVLDVLLHRSHWARQAFAKLAGAIPRWVIWTIFLSSIGAASHLVSGWAMIALAMAVATFGFVMLAWLSAEDKRV